MDKHQQFFNSHFNVIEIGIGVWTSLVTQLVIVCIYVCVCVCVCVCGEGQGSLVCCGPWRHEELDTTW